jgi:group II intron reverse transcriptase/maturase
MQSAETVLGVLRERGKRGLPCTQLYRQLFNPQLYLLAYGRIYANKGAMTPGVTQETVDGMSLGKIGRIIDAMRHERYRFCPVRRVHIPKKTGKTRPLGLPTWSDKLVGEVVRLLLEAYYEPAFSDRSHGFRPGRGCHTALREVANTWTGTSWFIEGDIADCFGSFDHSILLSIVGEKIRDNRFLRLLHTMLQAGYLEDWTWNATLSGAPQGGVASPVLSNIYLHRLDEFVETVLIPDYTRGRLRARNPEYRATEYALARARRRGDRAEVRSLYRRLHSLPSQDPHDPGYRRLRYCRYADDTLLGFVGPKAEAEQIKSRLAAFLRDDLALTLSPDKTLITHARSQRARFLGYEIAVASSDRRTRRPTTTDRRNRRSVNGTIVLHVPASVIKAKGAPYLARGKPACRNFMVNEADYNIVGRFGAEYRGIVQYYLLAGDVFRLHRLRWVMETSMLKTLARKHRSSVSKMAARHKAKLVTPHGPRTCFEASVARVGRKPLVARFGGIPLKRHKGAVLTDRVTTGPVYPNKELIRRLQAGRCELCKRTDSISVHHVRSLAVCVS